MGVMSCQRKDCQNVMCRSSINGQLVCKDCKEEFTTKFTDKILKRSEFIKEFETFMKSPKDDDWQNANEEIDVHEFIDSYGFNED